MRYDWNTRESRKVAPLCLYEAGGPLRTTYAAAEKHEISKRETSARKTITVTTYPQVVIYFLRTHPTDENTADTEEENTRFINSFIQSFIKEQRERLMFLRGAHLRGLQP